MRAQLFALFLIIIAPCFAMELEDNIQELNEKKIIPSLQQMALDMLLQNKDNFELYENYFKKEEPANLYANSFLEAYAEHGSKIWGKVPKEIETKIVNHLDFYGKISCIIRKKASEKFFPAAKLEPFDFKAKDISSIKKGSNPHNGEIILQNGEKVEWLAKQGHYLPFFCFYHEKSKKCIAPTYPLWHPGYYAETLNKLKKVKKFKLSTLLKFYKKIEGNGGKFESEFGSLPTIEKLFPEQKE